MKNTATEIINCLESWVRVNLGGLTGIVVLPLYLRMVN